VDSSPISQLPPSRTLGAFSPKESKMCCGQVGLVELERLALGAASGKSRLCRTSLKRGWAGARRATLGKPAEIRSGMQGFLGRIMVRGPGQKCFAKTRAV